MQVDWFEGLPLLFWGTAHLLGVVFACLTRLSFGPRVEGTVRAALALSIVAVTGIGLSTEIASAVGWVASGATLGLMVIASVWESSAQPPHDPVLARLLASHEPA